MLKAIFGIFLMILSFNLLAEEKTRPEERYALMGVISSSNEDSNVAVVWDYHRKKSFTVLKGSRVDASENHVIKSIRKGKVVMDLNGSATTLRYRIDQKQPELPNDEMYFDLADKNEEEVLFPLRESIDKYKKEINDEDKKQEKIEQEKNKQVLSVMDVKKLADYFPNLYDDTKNDENKQEIDEDSFEDVDEFEDDEEFDYEY